MIDIRKALEVRGVLYHQQQGTPDEITLCCPFCRLRGETEDTRFRLGVNVRKHLAHCYNCEWKARGEWLQKALVEALRLPLIDGGSWGKDLSSSTNEAVKSPFVFRLPESFCLFHWPRNSRQEAKQDEFESAVYHYLQSRRITAYQVRAKKIGYCITGLFAYRIVFPVWGVDRRLVGAVGRDWTGQSPKKYLNSSGIKTFYNAHRLADEGSRRPVVLVEGLMDALALERVGQKALAILGSSLTDYQLDLLKRIKMVGLMADMDVAGLKSVVQTADRLLAARPGRAVRVYFPVRGKDAGGLDENELRASLSNSCTYSPLAALRIKNMAEHWTDNMGRVL